MRRRTFLRDGLGLLLAAPAVWAQSIPGPSSRSDEVRAICSLSPSSESAIRLGEKYLSLHPEYRDSRLLADLIFSGWSDSQRRLALSDRRILKEMLAGKIRRDFRLENVSSLDGWRLSETELRQWALLSLVA